MGPTWQGKMVLLDEWFWVNLFVGKENFLGEGVML